MGARAGRMRTGDRGGWHTVPQALRLASRAWAQALALACSKAEISSIWAGGEVLLGCHPRALSNCQIVKLSMSASSGRPSCRVGRCRSRDDGCGSVEACAVLAAPLIAGCGEHAICYQSPRSQVPGLVRHQLNLLDEDNDNDDDNDTAKSVLRATSHRTLALIACCRQSVSNISQWN
jgi:hypothetical protein